MRHIVENEAIITWKRIRINLLLILGLYFAITEVRQDNLTHTFGLVLYMLSSRPTGPETEWMGGPTEGRAGSLEGTISVAPNCMSAGFPSCDWPATQHKLNETICIGTLYKYILAAEKTFHQSH